MSDDLILQGGTVFDGTGAPRYRADIAVKGDRIALQMPGNPLGLARDDVIIEQSNSTKTALISANMGGSSLCTIDVGGLFGRDLSAQGEKAMVAFAVEWLQDSEGVGISSGASPWILRE